MTPMQSSLHVLIIGGYGEFGSRLAQLLLRDEHRVVIAGRNLDKAQRFCHANDGTPLKLDIATDLNLIDTLGVDVVVDAAGPFQSYGEDDQRYRVARKALECNAHYLDLSDDGNFSRGISCLDALAKQHRRFALSGASSTPALSGAVVTAFNDTLSSIDKIETSILPGARAPQGQSVMLAILNQVGNPIPFWRNGQWEDHIGWSMAVPKSISNAVCRHANLINTADAVLFPEHFKAKSVIFRAGLAMPIMHRSLQWLGWLRSIGLLPNLTTFVSPLRWLANRLTPFGSDDGGMLVEVIGAPSPRNTNNEAVASEISLDEPCLVTNTWCLAAQPSQGPFVPTIPTRAILRNIEQIPFGARACISELSLAHYVSAMDDLEIDTSTHTQAFNYVFADVLGERWKSLPESLRRTHTVVDKKTLNGYAKITRGTSWTTQLIAKIFTFPSAAEKIAVEVIKTRVSETEIWVRNFDGQRFKSTLRPVASKRHQSTDKLLQEQFGLLKFLLKLELRASGLYFPVVSGSCLGIPIPKVLLPESHAHEFEKDDTMHFCVELLAPFKLGLIVRYEGWLK